MPHPRDRLLATERETSKLLIQHPELFPPGWDGLREADFTHPAYAAVFAAVEKAAADGVPGAGDAAAACRLGAPDRRGRRVEEIRSLVAALAVEPLPVQGEVDAAIRGGQHRRAAAAHRDARDRELKSRLQRTNPVEAQRSYNQMFSELVVLEATAQGTAHPQHRCRGLGFWKWLRFCCSTMPRG